MKLLCRSVSLWRKWTYHRWQSKLQRVQHLNNLQNINELNIEKHGPCTSPTAVLKTELEKQRARADDNARKLHNKACEAQRAKTPRDLLHLEKQCKQPFHVIAQ